MKAACTTPLSAFPEGLSSQESKADTRSLFKDENDHTQARPVTASLKQASWAVSWHSVGDHRTIPNTGEGGMKDRGVTIGTPRVSLRWG